jgi:hypothetical protein
VPTEQILAQTLERLNRVNEALREVETGDWTKHFGDRAGLKTLESWIGQIRGRGIAQACLDLEAVLKREDQS